MRSLGWDRKRKAHELRAEFGSAMVEANDAYSAQLALGHQDLKTTARYAARPAIRAVDPRSGLEKG